MFISKRKKLIKILCWILFILYVGALVYFLFFAEQFGRADIAGGYHYNLIPLKEIKRFWVYRQQVGLLAASLNLAGNILIFMPFGFLIPIMIWKLRGFFRVIRIGFELSLIVECVQLVTRTGSFDVDDLILNTLGCLCGYGIYVLIRRRWDCKMKLLCEDLEQESLDGE